MFRNKNYQACRNYRDIENNSIVNTANAHALVLILYQNLHQSLDIVAKCNAHLHNTIAMNHLIQADTIIAQLENGLDLEYGGQLAHSLAAIYKSMRKEIIKNMSLSSQERIVILRNSVKDLEISWRNIK